MQGVFADLTGQTFGLLRVIGLGRDDPKRTFWKCVCVCGTEVECRSDYLSKRNDCGCQKTSKPDIDLIGKTFGRLTVTSLGTRRPRGWTWNCRCECGNTVAVTGGSLRSGHTKSCGCIQREKATEQAVRIGRANKTHGMCNSSEWVVWRAMRARCENPNSPSWGDYGGRGIRLCERWLQFENFLADMGPRPSLRHTIDRYPDQNGNYEPGNCRWATHKEQQRNRRDNIVIELDGKKQCIAAWAEEYGMKTSSLWQRIVRQKMSLADALQIPVQKRTPRKKS